MSESAWEVHFQTQHETYFSQASLRLAREGALQTQEIEWIDNQECPLCCTNMNVSRRSFVKHVGAHMEEIALIALPRNVDEDEDQAHKSSDCGSHESSPSGALSAPLALQDTTVRLHNSLASDDDGHDSNGSKRKDRDKGLMLEKTPFKSTEEMTFGEHTKIRTPVPENDDSRSWEAVNHDDIGLPDSVSRPSVCESPTKSPFKL